MQVTFRDWLELLGIDDAVDELLTGSLTFTEARSRASGAKLTWPSVSQDYIAVLEQLEPFFDEVGAAIDEQAELVDRFNGIMGDFGFGITPPVDRLLTEADIDEMREQRQQLADEFSDLRSAMEALQDEIEALMDELNDLLSGMDEGDPFAGERIQELADELQELFDTIDAEGCLP